MEEKVKISGLEDLVSDIEKAKRLIKELERMIDPNNFCINTKEAGCIWGTVSSFETANATKEPGKHLCNLVFLGQFTEYNGKKYIVLRDQNKGINHIIEL